MSESAQRLAERLSLPPWLRWRPSAGNKRSMPPRFAQGLVYGVMMLQDVLYCLVCAIALTLILYATGDGQMRLSAPVAFGIGWGMYAATIGTLVRRLSGYLVVLARALLVWAVSLAIAPIGLSARLLWHKSAPLRKRASCWLVRCRVRIQAEFYKRKERRRAKKTSSEQENEHFVPHKPNDKHYFSTRPKPNA